MVQKMMGHKTLQMINERYYSYIKNYQRNDGSAFKENVYNPSKDKKIEETDNEVVTKEVRDIKSRI